MLEFTFSLLLQLYHIWNIIFINNNYIYYLIGNHFVLLHASKTRTQEVALRLLRASVISISTGVELNNSRNWLIHMLTQMCTTFPEFEELLNGPKETVHNSLYLTWNKNLQITKERYKKKGARKLGKRREEKRKKRDWKG